MIKLAITGACGRMGGRLVTLSHESEAFEVVAALEQNGHDSMSADIGTIVGIGTIGVDVTAEPVTKPDVVIDFTCPAAMDTWADYCLANSVPLVIGTTGLSDKQVGKLKIVSEKTPVLFAPNMSLGMNLLFQLVGQVAEKLGDAYDIEITETHHRFKKDAPSGTALKLAEQVAAAKQWPFPGCLDFGRHGKEALREKDTIGMHALRAGDTVGDHTVVFGALGETVELRHSAHTRDTFVHGALHGARWLVGQTPGLYSMTDVLGL